MFALRPDPAQRARLGEVDGLKVSLDAANQKLAQMQKIRAQARMADLPLPAPRPTR